MIGHLDPAFLAELDEVQAALRRLFGTANPMTLPLSATGSAGMEACLVNLVERGQPHPAQGMLSAQKTNRLHRPKNQIL